MIVKLLTEHHLEFLSLKGGCTGCSESALVKVQYCWKSLVMAQIFTVPARENSEIPEKIAPDDQGHHCHPLVAILLRMAII